MYVSMAFAVKGIVPPQNCNYLLTLKLFQTCLSFFFPMNTKDISKNVGNQTVAGSH